MLTVEQLQAIKDRWSGVPAEGGAGSNPTIASRDIRRYLLLRDVRSLIAEVERLRVRVAELAAQWKPGVGPRTNAISDGKGKITFPRKGYGADGTFEDTGANEPHVAHPEGKPNGQS